MAEKPAEAVRAEPDSSMVSAVRSVADSNARNVEGVAVTTKSPSATERTALTIEESGFARTASAGFSAMPIAVGATTSSRPPVSRPAGPCRSRRPRLRQR